MRPAFRINGRRHVVKGSPDTALLYVLRNEVGLSGPRFGCGLAQCGACSVLVDGKEVRSCITPASRVDGKDVTSLEGLPQMYADQKKRKLKDGELHPLQEAWIAEQVPQCGYCQSGMLVTAAELLAENPKPTNDEIKAHLNGHLCRCGTYQDIVRAVQIAAKEMAS
jgi:aerobic-type carbon monoxide dehydrogenase small subunit (CoxS/CutS family)